MNPIFSPWVLTGGVLGGVTITTFILLQAIVMWWQGRGLKNETPVEPKSEGSSDSLLRWVTYALVSVAGLVAMFLLLKDTVWISFSVFGIFAVVPYAFLNGERFEAAKWKTRACVLHFLESVQVLAHCHTDKSVTELCPWLERSFGSCTLSKKLDARLVDLIGQGLAIRGSSADLERIAGEIRSDDLVQFIRRTHSRNDNGKENRAAQHAAEQVAERTYMDAENKIAQIVGQVVWLWLGIAVVFAIGAIFVWRIS